MYTGVFLRFIHGVLDEFREAEAFLFHTRLAHVSDAMKGKGRLPRAHRLSVMAQGAGAAPGSARVSDLQPLARGARDPFAHLRDDRVDGYETGDAALLGREIAAAGAALLRDRLAQPDESGWQGDAEAAGIRAALPQMSICTANTLGRA